MRIEDLIREEKQPIKIKDKTPIFTPHEIPKKLILQLKKNDIMHEINKRLKKIDVLTSILDIPNRASL